MIQTQIHRSMLGKLPAYNTTVSDFMGDFSNLSLYCNLRCGGQGSRSACSKESRAQPVPQRRTGRWWQLPVFRTTQLSIYGYAPYCMNQHLLQAMVRHLATLSAIEDKGRTTRWSTGRNDGMFSCTHLGPSGIILIIAPLSLSSYYNDLIYLVITAISLGSMHPTRAI